MKDIGSIRSVYSGLLSGITYNGKSVPFYTEEPFVTTPDNYIYINAITQEQNNNDQRFINQVVVTLEVVSKSNMKNTYSAVDSISNSVLTALLPDTYTDRNNTDFQIMIMSATSPGYLHVQDGSVHINRKIIRVFNHLMQK